LTLLGRVPAARPTRSGNPPAVRVATIERTRGPGRQSTGRPPDSVRNSSCGARCDHRTSRGPRSEEYRTPARLGPEIILAARQALITGADRDKRLRTSCKRACPSTLRTTAPAPTVTQYRRIKYRLRLQRSRTIGAADSPARPMMRLTPPEATAWQDDSPSQRNGACRSPAASSARRRFGLITV
jgi:hypothetical protein